MPRPVIVNEPVTVKAISEPVTVEKILEPVVVHVDNPVSGTLVVDYPTKRALMAAIILGSLGGKEKSIETAIESTDSLLDALGQ